MLETQQYLLENNLESLEKELGISHTISECGKKVILNYCQINSPKNNEIVRECRGLCLEVGTWRVVAKSFNRFYNWGELPEYYKDFNFKSFSTQEKVDGSLLKLYHYNGEWKLQTRGSFANGEIVNGANHTWYSLFFPFFKNLDKLYKGITLVCEGVSPYNQVVRFYEKPDVYLLTAFNNENLYELSIEECDEIADVIGLKRPQQYSFCSIEDMKQYLEDLKGDPSFEGFVIRDDNNMRAKLKSQSYCSLHHLCNNQNLFLVKNILPIVLKGEQEEVLLFWPSFRDKFECVCEAVDKLKGRLSLLWNDSRDIVSQKEFALAIKDEPAKAILFNARKYGNLEKAWKESENIILKELEKGIL